MTLSVMEHCSMVWASLQSQRISLFLEITKVVTLKETIISIPNTGTYGVTPFLLESCTLDSSSGLVMAECDYDDAAFIDGYLVLAQNNDMSKVRKLYINQTTNVSSPVTILVEESGEYKVSVFPIMEETGILFSSVEYISLLDVVAGIAACM